VKIRGVHVSTLVRAAGLYARRRVFTPSAYFRGLLEPSAGRAAADAELRDARGIDVMLRRAGVHCLWRSAIVTESLRRRGIAARIRLFVSRDDGGLAHAESEIKGELLRPTPDDMVAMR
jgi:hypothetical protein